MRVALNLEQLLHRPPGGIGRYSAELARLLPVDAPGADRVELLPFVARHERVTVEAALIPFALEHLDPARLALPRIVLDDLWNDLGLGDLRRLSRRLRDFDVVHAPSLAVPPKSGAKLVVTVHDAAPILFPKTYTRRGRWFHERGFAAAAKRADAVIAPTGVAADEVAGCTPIPRSRIRVVPHGVVQREVGDGLVASTRANLAIGDAPYVLWVGTLEPRKNVGVLVEGFRRMVERDDLPHRLVVVGPKGWLGAAEALREPAAALGKRILFTGPVRADRLLALFRGADLLALPSVHEGFGLPVIEAMSQATPVVCADIPVLHEVGGDAARYVAPHEPDAWATELAALLHDDAARRDLGAAGRARASQFTWERCAEQTREVYRDVLKG
ncbi:MAG TPA: glycosyltransferase family 1 protein [Acidimicrobiia bacterium]|nr:glycosyltransferase family 1 protein [Acidimicrobiia bacterium]